MRDEDGSAAVESAEEPGTSTSNGDPVVRAEGVWKVFGPHGERVIGTPDADLSRADLREKSGNVMAADSGELRRHKVSMVFQHFGLLAHRRVIDDVTIINKLFSKKFADSGSPAYDVLKKFKTTNADQDAVAKAIAGDKVDPDKAGQDWVEENADTVDTWLQ